MAGRPRSVSDADILHAAARVISRVGPGALTLADVSDAVGLTPAALLRRFGSKRGLLLAVTADGAREVAARFAERLRIVEEGGGPAVAAVLEELCDHTEVLSRPEELANHLAFLQLDLRDADFRQHALDYVEAERKGVRALLEIAMRRGELASTTGMPADADTLARAVQIARHGSLLLASMRPSSDGASRLRRDVEQVLAPYRMSRNRR